MKVKALIAILMVAVMVFGSMSAVLADNGAPSEKNVKLTGAEAKKIAIETLKNKFGIEIDEKKYNGSMNLQPDYGIIRKYTWQISWNMFDGENSSYIFLSVDANSGALLNFNYSEHKAGQPDSMIPQLTEEQARKIGEDILKKVNPEEFKQTEYRDERYINYYGGYRPVIYSFLYVRKIDGVAFEGNSLRIGIDGITGKVNSYQCSWNNELVFPKNQGVIDAAKAKALLRNSLALILNYQNVRSKTVPSKVTGIRLIYTPDYRKGNMLDAFTGEMLGVDGKPMEASKTRSLTLKQISDMIAGKSAPKLEKELDSESAKTIMTEKVKEAYGDGYIVENVNYSESDNYYGSRSRKAWTGELRKKDSEFSGQYLGNISLDARTGEILNLAKYSWGEGSPEAFTPKITWDQAYDKAIETIVKYYPHRMKEIETEQTYYDNSFVSNEVVIPERRIYFNFTRKYNDVNYSENSINISFDTKTGELGDIYYNWDDEVRFINPAPVIDIEGAKKVLCANNDAELNYALIINNKDMNNPQYGVKLVYTLRNKDYPYFMGNVDASTGKLVNYDGQEFSKTENDFYEKIKNHWAEKELNILAFQGIIDVTNFDADREITLMELLRMMVRAKGYDPYRPRDVGELKFSDIQKDSDDYGYVLEAVRLGLVENKAGKLDGTRKVSKEEAAELLVKLIKYDRLAAVEGIFKLGFKDTGDINADRFGAVAICKGLGIMDGKDGMFKPKSNATMLEAALAVYKALGEITNPR